MEIVRARAAERGPDELAPQKRWIRDDDVKASRSPVEHLGECKRPVKGPQVSRHGQHPVSIHSRRAEQPGPCVLARGIALGNCLPERILILAVPVVQKCEVPRPTLAQCPFRESFGESIHVAQERPNRVLVDAPQAIATTQVRLLAPVDTVSLPLDRDQHPKRELAQLDRERLDVDAMTAVLDDLR